MQELVAAVGFAGWRPVSVVLAAVGPTEHRAGFVGTSKFVFLFCRRRVLECDSAGLAD